jgi:uncharacterized protein (DUF2267 family)
MQRQSNPTVTGIAPVDEATPAAMLWIEDLKTRLGWHDSTLVFLALRASLHAFRDSLPPAEAVFLGGSLPLLLRGVFYEGWHMRDEPLPVPDRQSFLERIHDGLDRRLGVDPEQIAVDVFALLAARLPPDEVEDVKAITPEALHFLWPSGAASA